jgi:hypothetical protein
MRKFRVLLASTLGDDLTLEVDNVKAADSTRAIKTAQYMTATPHTWRVDEVFEINHLPEGGRKPGEKRP